jgi:hypothetical protein
VLAHSLCGLLILFSLYLVVVQASELASVLSSVFHLLCGKPKPQAALVELREAFVNADK